MTNVVQMKARNSADGFVVRDAHRKKLIPAYNAALIVALGTGQA